MFSFIVVAGSSYTNIPSNMHDGEHDIKPENLADAFADKFEHKINTIKSSTALDENVHNDNIKSLFLNTR